MALQTYGDIRTDFLAKMNQSTTAAFYSEQIIKNWFDMAHEYAASKYKWPMTFTRYSTTAASATTNEDGWTRLTYPEGFRTDTVRLMTVAGARFQKKNFYKFQSFLEDNPADTTKLYTDQGRNLFINPQASGFSGTVVLWGQFNLAPIAYDTSASGIGDPSATTIFTGNEETGNEAILFKMISYALIKEKSPTSVIRGKMVSASGFNAQVADSLLDAIWKRVGDEQFAYTDTLNEGMWKRFDVTRGGFSEDLFKRDQWMF